MKAHAAKARAKFVAAEDTRTPALPAWARLDAGALHLALHVQPGARRDAVAGPHGTRLKIALRAPPVEGQANEALRRYVADVLGLRMAQVRLVSGAASRDKVLALECHEGKANELLALLLAPSTGS